MRIATVVALWFLATPWAHAQKSGEPRPWPHENSDVPVHPAMQFGHLDNGLRYAWVMHPFPPNAVSLRMHVNVGSIDEEPGERGMAHFVEHMAFNGTTNFEAGELRRWFEEQGMSFGADANAYTSFHETVYELDLPENDPDRILQALQVLRDYAEGILFEEDEIEKEKGVIDAEQRERDSPEYRIQLAWERLLLRGTRYPERSPIGVKADRDRFDHDRMRRFYDRWYRPENVTVLIAGDLPMDPTQWIEEQFWNWKPPAAPPPPHPDLGVRESVPGFHVVHETEAAGVQIMATWAVPGAADVFTQDSMREDVAIQTAMGIINRRFQQLADEPGSPFFFAYLSQVEYPEVVSGMQLSLSCDTSRWEEALSACEQELRRWMTHGFMTPDFRESKLHLYGHLSVHPSPDSIASSELLWEMVHACSNEYVPTRHDQYREIIQPAYDDLTPESVHNALKQYENGELTVILAGDHDLGDDAAGALEEAWRRSTAVEVEPEDDYDFATFAYRSGQAEGEVADHNYVSDLEVLQARFANGVRVNVRPVMNFTEPVQINVRVGEGRMALDPADVDIAWLAEQYFLGGGLGEHDAAQLDQLMRRKNVHTEFAVGHDSLVLFANTSRNDFRTQCELICAYLRDPGWDEDVWDDFQEHLPRIVEDWRKDHWSGQRTFFQELHGGDPRYGSPDPDAVDLYGLDDVRDFLEPQLADGPIEVTVSGPADLNMIMSVLGQTFGLLEPRRDREELEGARLGAAPIPGLERTYRIESEEKNALVMALFPGPDGDSPAWRPELVLFQVVLNQRVHEEVRENLSASYSPYAQVYTGLFEGDGRIKLQSDAEPEMAPRVLEAFRAVVERMVEEGVQDDELARSKTTMLADLEADRDSPNYWVAFLSGSQEYPDRLEKLRKLHASYQAVDAAQVTALAREFLDLEQMSTCVILPKE